MKGNPRNGRPSTSISEENIDAVRILIEGDRRIITQLIAFSLNISDGSAYTILVENLGLNKLSAGWVPKLLRPDQQQTRAGLSTATLSKWDEDPEHF